MQNNYSRYSLMLSVADNGATQAQKFNDSMKAAVKEELIELSYSVYSVIKKWRVPPNFSEEYMWVPLLHEKNPNNLIEVDGKLYFDVYDCSDDIKKIYIAKSDKYYRRFWIPIDLDILAGSDRDAATRLRVVMSNYLLDQAKQDIEKQKAELVNINKKLEHLNGRIKKLKNYQNKRNNG